MKKKRIIIIAVTVVSVVVVSGVSYLKGHRDGSVMSEVRSLSYELPILEDIEKDRHYEARDKLTSLVEFRSAWVGSDLTIWESWKYWSGVNEVTSRDHALSRTKEVVSRVKKLEKEGFLMENVNMNDMVAWLASQAKLQYVHNQHLNDPKYSVSGRMNDVVDPKVELSKLAKAFDLHIEIEGDTLYVRTSKERDPSASGADNDKAEQDAVE